MAEILTVVPVLPLPLPMLLILPAIRLRALFLGYPPVDSVFPSSSSSKLHVLDFVCTSQSLMLEIPADQTTPLPATLKNLTSLCGDLFPWRFTSYPSGTLPCSAASRDQTRIEPLMDPVHTSPAGVIATAVTGLLCASQQQAHISSPSKTWLVGVKSASLSQTHTTPPLCPVTMISRTSQTAMEITLTFGGPAASTQGAVSMSSRGAMGSLV
mmetsp:Transcript_5667/g.35229  ORF Transcript_5667/g.35229 Transcript_5667/m.35229 type:complete len:212 (-) Transcript_5667:754-1389(-)